MFHTTEDGSVGREEGVLESLLVVAGLEGVLLQENVVHVLASELCDFISTVAVENAKEGEASTMLLVLLAIGLQKGQDGTVGILHADAPALHGRHAIEHAVIFAFGRLLKGYIIVSGAGFARTAR